MEKSFNGIVKLCVTSGRGCVLVFDVERNNENETCSPIRRACVPCAGFIGGDSRLRCANVRTQFLTMKTENAFSYGKTSLALFRNGWGGSSFVRSGSRALCSDGKVRSLSYVAAQADTFFSVPAAVRIGKVYVRGYLTTEQNDAGQRAIAFRQMVNGLGSLMLPRWPTVFTEEHNKLISSVYNF